MPKEIASKETRLRALHTTCRLLLVHPGRMHTSHHSSHTCLHCLLQGWVYSILYVLFENAMGTVKLWAVITGVPPQLAYTAR